MIPAANNKKKRKHYQLNYKEIHIKHTITYHNTNTQKYAK